MNPTALFWMVLLLLANGFFVAAEFAYITARRNVLEATPTRSSHTAVRLTGDLSLTLAAAQMGITMASLLLGAVAEPAVAAILERLLGFLPMSDTVLHGISLVIALLIVVFLHMVFGEMAPKNVAISHPERSAMVLAVPFRAFIIVFRPLIALLNGIANGVLRLFGVPPTTALETSHSAEDLAVIIAAGQEEGVIEEFTHRLLSEAIVFTDRDASEVMVPRPDVVAAHADATVGEIQELMRSTGHSRIPLHTGDLDDTLGFIHVKDLLSVDEERLDEPVDRSLIRPALVVPETAGLKSVLDEMRKARRHLSLVIDEHGSVTGVITLEDIAEELVGEISDEHDPEARRRVVVDEGRIVAAGSVRPDELARHGVELGSGEYKTIGGLIIDRLGRLARRGDTVESEGWLLKVRSTAGRRVAEVEITRVPDPPPG